MQYEQPRLSPEGSTSDLILSFGGIYKNPPTSDGQSCGVNNGLCPAEADE
ncbi:MAG: hypothetical protein JNM66_14670 [Bryobacterales bacterium]|nr:hypothetical protein [Bryobacterales bacterium]